MSGHEPEDPFSIVDYPGSFLHEVDLGVKGLRVAWSPDLGFAPVEPEVRAICEAAAKRVAELGCTVEEASPVFPNPSADLTFFTIAATPDAVWLGALSDEQRALLDEPARQFLAFGKQTTGTQLIEAERRRMAIWHTMRRFHETYDMLLTPVLSCTAFPTGQPPTAIGGKEIPQFGWMTYTNPFNLTGQPAASVPCGFDSRGLPVGLHVIGRAYEDSVVLRAARAFEQLQPWADKRPAMAGV
jgi:aspartyl-tRNA(Asn)/glutamyl-tRNA(Gln) amidotransferase subunit A